MDQSPKGLGDLKKRFGPEDVFNYIYAVFHSPTYRKRYAEFLKIDFPRVPLTSDKKLFPKLCQLGGELVSLHLMESPKLSEFVTTYPVSGDHVVEKPRYVDSTSGQVGEGLAPSRRKSQKPGGDKPRPYQNTGKVYINKTQYFDGVPKDVWEFHIGGYQVCEKWLKDRKGGKLSNDDLDHYQKIVVALRETIRLMGEIDEAIPEWPMR